MDDRRPTLDEIRLVRIDECRMNGHTWHFVDVVGREDPMMILCSNCGRQCWVMSPPERDEEQLRVE